MPTSGEDPPWVPPETPADWPPRILQHFQADLERIDARLAGVVEEPGLLARVSLETSRGALATPALQARRVLVQVLSAALEQREKKLGPLPEEARHSLKQASEALLGNAGKIEAGQPPSGSAPVRGKPKRPGTGQAHPAGHDCFPCRQ